MSAHTHSALETLPAKAVGDVSAPGRLRYSFVTLVTDAAQYAEMVQSFVAKGFTPERAEFLYADNTARNWADGYRGLNRLIQDACGDYIICAHQDVIATDDGCDELEQRLSALTERDPDWAIAANAERRDGTYFIRIHDKHGRHQNRGPFPAQVDVVDENFIIIRRDRIVGFSYDLSGYHLYGLDLVLNAQMRGLNAYVIDFLVEHKGAARVGQSYLDCQAAFERKIRRKWSSRIIPTLVENIHLSGQPLRFSHRLVGRWVRRVKILAAERRNSAAPRGQNS